MPLLLSGLDTFFERIYLFGVHSDGVQRNHLPEPSNGEPENVDVRENPAFNVPAKIAYFVFFIWICASAVGIVIFLVRGDEHPWNEIVSIVVGTILTFGPMIGAIISATRRHSRRVRQGQ